MSPEPWSRSFSTQKSKDVISTRTSPLSKEEPRASSIDFSKSGKTPEPGQTTRHPDRAPNDWDENPNFDISTFAQLPSSNFGVNQHMLINDEFKEALRQILWQFRAPIRYAFAYGSGVFPQTAPGLPSSPASPLHPKPSQAVSTAQGKEAKMIDFIFGVSYTQHWHSLNLQQHRDHYSAVGSLGSYVVSRIQDNWGAGVYFNPYVKVNGTLIKYGVVNLDTLCQDLSEWDTLYLAGRLQKPVKILRDDPRVRLANQINLISAVRTALLLLPAKFTELDLYSTIAGISYLGDPRMNLPTENPHKVSNIVNYQLPYFRRLYAPLIENLPNVSFADANCTKPGWAENAGINVSVAQDMDPVKRGNMVRRLPKRFRKKLYFRFQSKYQIPQLDFEKMLEESNDEDSNRVRRRQGGPFEQRVAHEEPSDLRKEVTVVLKKTIWWPSSSQTLKSGVTAGIMRTWRYLKEKRQKYNEGMRKVQRKEDQASKKSQ